MNVVTPWYMLYMSKGKITYVYISHCPCGTTRQLNVQQSIMNNTEQGNALAKPIKPYKIIMSRTHVVTYIQD